MGRSTSAAASTMTCRIEICWCLYAPRLCFGKYFPTITTAPSTKMPKSTAPMESRLAETFFRIEADERKQHRQRNGDGHDQSRAKIIEEENEHMMTTSTIPRSSMFSSTPGLRCQRNQFSCGRRKCTTFTSSSVQDFCCSSSSAFASTALVKHSADLLARAHPGSTPSTASILVHASQTCLEPRRVRHDDNLADVTSPAPASLRGAHPPPRCRCPRA